MNLYKPKPRGDSSFLQLLVVLFFYDFGKICRTGMLNKGVERIVEQIVNPKIMQLIKPKTDEVTCDVLGISLTEHKNTLKRKQLEQQEKLLKSPDTPGIPNMLNVNFSSPPPGKSLTCYCYMGLFKSCSVTLSTYLFSALLITTCV